METSFGELQFNNGAPSLRSNVLGVDLTGLMDSLVQVKRLPILDKEADISQNALKLAAFGELETLSKSLESAALNLRAPTVSMGGTDVFKSKAAFAQSNGSTPPASLMSITTTKNAEVGEFTLTVNRLATTDVINGGGTFSATTDQPVTTDGNLVINGETVALTTGDSLESIRDAINASTRDSGVRASIVKVDATTYKLSLQATETGKAIDLTGSDAGILTDLSLAASGKTDTALSAELEYNGITITRQQNSIKDLVDGVTFDLFTADPTSELTVSVTQNNESIKNGIVAFVDAYNNMMAFGKVQRDINADGTIPEESILFNDSTLRDLMSRAQNTIASAVGGVDGINNLREAGITLNEDNLLEIDNAILDDAIVEKGDEIRNLFSFNATYSNNNIQVLSRPDSGAAGNLEVRVLETDVDGKPLSAEIDFNGETYTARIANGIIYGPDDTDAEGFAFGYLGAVVNAGDPAAVTTIKTTQGIADLLGSYLESFNNVSTGNIATVKQELEDSTSRLEDQIIDIEERVELYRERLASQFLAVEQQISVLNSISQSLEAQFDAMNNKN